MRIPSLVLRIILLSSLLFGAGTALADFGVCESAEYMRVFDLRLGASSCDVVDTIDITANGRTTKMRVLKLRGSALGDPEALKARFRELARSVGAAMEKMVTVSLGDVSVLLTDTPPPDDSYAHSWILDRLRALPPPLERGISERECQITFFKGNSHSLEDFYFAYAHELFHCMQYRLWERQMTVGDAKSWWSEHQCASMGSDSIDSYLNLL